MFLLYHKTTRPTGRALAQALGIPSGTEGRAVGPLDTVIRWGNRRPLNCLREINPMAAIALSSDKLASLRVLKEHGVRVPAFATSAQDMPDGMLVGRTRRGKGGEGIVVYGNKALAAEGPQHELYTQYIFNHREYRLHVVGREVIRVQRKYLEREGVQEALVKNHAAGYVFKTPEKNLNQSRLDMAIKAVAALDLDFGAVDMVIDHEGKEWVLEVNSAPACAPMTLDAYRGALARYAA